MTAPRMRRAPTPLRLARVRASAPATTATDGAQWRAALRIASEAASAALTVDREGGWPEAELQAGASALCVAAEELLYGFAGAQGVPGLSPALPAARLLAAMRRSILMQARGQTVTPAVALTILDALESLEARLDQDAGQRFASRLVGMGGLELIVDVAHDMRSPVGSILFLAEQVRRGSSGPVTPVQERQLGLIYGAALGLSTMASDVMDLARGGEKLAEQAPQALSIRSIFQQVDSLVRPMAEERGLELRFDTCIIEPRVGQAQALQRVLLNLVCNAIKFTAEGSVSVTATPVSASGVRFVVQDTGRGIPESVQGTMFDAFRRRLKPGQYIFSSAGLGLSICQTLVRAMGGELLVASCAGNGSRFEFEVALGRHGND